MKILQVVCQKTWGGGSVVIHEITRALIARGDEVWIFKAEDECDSRFREIGAVLARPPVWNDKISPLDAMVLASLWRLCRKEKFDLVATHTSKGGFLGRLAACLAGVPNIVHHAHGFSFNKELSPGTKRFYVMLERFAAQTSDLIISVNEQHRQMAVALGVERAEKIQTIHNGIDLGPFSAVNREAARRELGFDDSVLLIGAIGRLAPQKGFLYLIRAFRILFDRFPSAHLVIAGSGPMKDDLEREVREKGLEGRVHFPGFRDDVPLLLAAFDVYAQPSLWEGHSISLIEALAAGKAIVATDIDGNREAIDSGETGLLVPPADPEALARGLELLLSGPAFARELGQQARRAAEERFTRERMVQQNLAAYDAVIGRKMQRQLSSQDARAEKLAQQRMSETRTMQ